MAAGHSLLVYPEGTTSPDGTIGEFKDGAFIIAVTSQVPVLPVTIDGTRRIRPPGRTAIHGGQVRVVIANPPADQRPDPPPRSQAARPGPQPHLRSLYCPGPGNAGQGDAINCGAGFREGPPG